MVRIKAKELFEYIGYSLTEESEEFIEYFRKTDNQCIRFDLINKSLHNNAEIDLTTLKAICLLAKELKWIK